MSKRRPRLRPRTTNLLYILEQAGPGGAAIDRIAQEAGLRTRQAAQRLRWLQRTHLVRYVHDSALWQLTDDSIFRPAAPAPRSI